MIFDSIYCFSTWSRETIEETVSVEFKTWKEVSLDIILYGKDFENNIAIQNHVESIICSSNYMEVFIFYINFLQKDIFCTYVHNYIYFRKEKLKFKELSLNIISID